MLRTHTCGELRISDVNRDVILTGWVQRLRDKGSLLWIDLRDRYGITQLLFDESNTPGDLMEQARELGREYVIQAEGTVVERVSKNDRMATGDIELRVKKLTVLNPSRTPPFTIERSEERRVGKGVEHSRRRPVTNKD